MTDITPLEVLTHLGAFGLGLLTMWVAVRREGRSLTHQEDQMDGTPESGGRGPRGKEGRPGPMGPAAKSDEHPGDRRRRRSIPFMLALVLVASAVLIAIGIQQSAYQRGNDQRDRCYDRWGKALYSTLDTRSMATKELEKADAKLARKEAKRDNALDEIIKVVIGLRTRPPEFTPADFDAVLERFAIARQQRDKAKGDRDEIAKDREDVQETNPYPELHC